MKQFLTKCGAMIQLLGSGKLGYPYSIAVIKKGLVLDVIWIEEWDDWSQEVVKLSKQEVEKIPGEQYLTQFVLEGLTCDDINNKLKQKSQQENGIESASVNDYWQNELYGKSVTTKMFYESEFNEFTTFLCSVVL